MGTGRINKRTESAIVAHRYIRDFVRDEEKMAALIEKPGVANESRMLDGIIESERREERETESTREDGVNIRGNKVAREDEEAKREVNIT